MEKDKNCSHTRANRSHSSGQTECLDCGELFGHVPEAKRPPETKPLGLLDEEPALPPDEQKS